MNKTYSLAYLNTQGQPSGGMTKTAAGIIQLVKMHRCLNSWNPNTASVMVLDYNKDPGQRIIKLIRLTH